MILTPEDRARRIDLGDGTFCCDRSLGGICYEHQQIADAIKEASEHMFETAMELAAQTAEDYDASDHTNPQSVGSSIAKEILKLSETIMRLP